MIWFSLGYLFNGISTTYRLFNAEVQFISKCLIKIVIIFTKFSCILKIFTLLIYTYLPTLPLGQDMAQGQFLSGV